MRNTAGQALVLVLLSLAVVLTLVLFILSRTVSDIAVSTTEEEAIRAFSAAEAGVEQALIVASDISNSSLGDASFDAQVSGFSEGSTTFEYPINLASGDTSTIWFVSHNADGSLGANSFAGNSVNICWGKVGTPPSSATTPAVELSVFYDASNVKIGRATFDPSASRTASNNFSSANSAGCTIGESSYQFSANVVFSDIGISVPSQLLFAKLRMLYNTDQNHPAGFDVTGQGILPSQGLDIDSTGQAGDANRRLNVFQAWPEPPSIFDFSIYSAGGLIKS